MRAENYYPGFKRQMKWGPDDVVGFGVPLEGGDIWYVDGDKSTGGAGQSWEDAFATIQTAVTAASAGDVIYVAGRTITALATDPVSYAETIIIPNATSNLSIIGVSRGRSQGGLPQIKIGAGSTAMLDVRAPGCLIQNIGFNGASSTGGGILLTDDGGTASVAFGTTIAGCHFKNCVGSTATNAATGGAIMWSATGGAWQTLISSNRFYKNVGDIVLLGTTSSVPQDVIIQDNIFSGPAANVDCNLYLEGGSGMNGVVIDSNIFQQKPAISSGTNARYIKATGCVGMMTRNMFGCLSAEGESEVTFQADGTAAFIPTTLHMAGNFGQFSTGVGAGLVSGEIFS